jgi:antitoxin component of MazEF toxin-antitoxin module
MKPKDYFRKVQKNNDSVFVYLPKAWCQILKLEQGDAVKIRDLKNGTLEITKAR